MTGRRLTVLGATGSVGVSTLDVVDHLAAAEAEAFSITALTGARNIDLLVQQALKYRPEIAVTAWEEGYDALRDGLAGSGVEVAAGAEAICEAAARPADICMAAIVGAAGLAPTLAAAAQGTTIALANKECLVAAGGMFLNAVEKGGATLIPVDSEHSAIFQALGRHGPEQVERLILTASGGPFRDWPLARVAAATPAEAVRHPNWDMGAKISVDSASMFNKALEMIEAHHLFGVAPERIEVLIHPQSIIHSMLGFRDGALMAQLGPPDMRGPIGYALNWPERRDLPVERVDFAALSKLDFSNPDEARFPALRLARRAMSAGGASGAVLNGAKEVALEAFLAGELGFLGMAEVVETVMDALADHPAPESLDDVFAADADARARARETTGLIAA